MTAMSTLAARRGVAMSQHIPDRPTVDRLPRRRSDQVQRVVGWLLVLAGLLTVVLAVVAASAAYDAGLDRIKQDAATRTTVVGVLLDDAPPIGPGPSRPTRVSYVDQTGRPQVGQVPVTGNLIAGTPVRVEVNGNGRVGIEPPTRGDAVFSAVAAGTAVTLGGILLLVFAWMGVRAVVLARNCTAWERQWRLVEPQWSGRGTAAP
jgi:hypothetical protein